MQYSFNMYTICSIYPYNTNTCNMYTCYLSLLTTRHSSLYYLSPNSPITPNTPNTPISLDSTGSHLP